MPTNYNPDTDALETMQERFEREAEVDEQIMRGELGKAAKTEHTSPLMYDEIWLQCPNRDSMSEWYGEATWAEDKINDDDTKYIRADIAESLKQQRDELLKALERSLESFEYIAKYGNSCGHSQLRIPDLKAAIASVKGQP